MATKGGDEKEECTAASRRGGGGVNRRRSDFSSLSLLFLPPIYFHLFPFPNGWLPLLHPLVFISWGFWFRLNDKGGVVVMEVDSHGFLTDLSLGIFGLA
ncbi:hypothetical protein RHMOL_Rhmol03G0175700 [Rhododendron molle]|uniref:Uncharacterized protein n=1 Tax=Rhododendron molle TaxID=49168 RepID=A0ACC0PF94_RHOML|nr:hypothetical protein RHMOL_Rhmol03G0175700 [Rhododendron molle]